MCCCFAIVKYKLVTTRTIAIFCMESQPKPSFENWHSGWGVVSMYKLISDVFGRVGLLMP